MPIETERKFFVENDGWKRLPLIKKINIVQGYLSSPTEKNFTVRIRVTDEQAFLTVKVEMGSRTSRYEYEQEIPFEEGKKLLKQCDRKLEKTRHVLRDDKNQIWEVDIFKKGLRGLQLAEIELPDEKWQVVLHPWLGEEVTGEPTFSNASLAKIGETMANLTEHLAKIKRK